MKFSPTYHWFSNVSYNESEEDFDCLVDIAETDDLTNGYFLVEEQFGLRVYPPTIQSKLGQKDIKLIGRAIKREKALQ